MSNKSGRFHYMTAADDAALRSDVLNELREENARLRTIQAELLAALEDFTAWAEGHREDAKRAGERPSIDAHRVKRARAAIARAKEQQP